MNTVDSNSGTIPGREHELRKGLRILQIRYTLMDAQFTNISAESELNELFALAKRGHHVTFTTARVARSDKNEGIVAPGFRVSFIPLRKSVPILSIVNFQLASCWRSLRAIGHLDALILDSVSALLLYPFLAVRRLASRRPTLILRVTSNPVEMNPLRLVLFTLFWSVSVKLAATLFDTVYFISPMMARHYSHMLHIPESKIGVWPSTVDLELFNPRSRKHRLSIQRLRKELATIGSLTFLYHGVFSRARGIVELVQAFRLLRDSSVKATLVLLGDGPARENVARYVKSNCLEDSVKICGPVPYVDVPPYIAACDVGIVPLPDHPWWRYQCPTRLLEYLAMNKPVIVSDIPAHRWMLGNSPIGVYLRATTAPEIAQGTRAFICADTHFDSRLGRRLSSGFSGERIAEMLEHNILSSLGSLRDRRFPSCRPS